MAYFDKKRRIKYAYKAMFILLVIIFAFIRFPSIYLIPFIKSPFILSHNVARISAVLFCLLSFLSGNPKKYLKNNQMFIVVSIYFIAVSLSIIVTQNINSFLTVYKDIIFSLMIGFGVFMTISKKNVYSIVRVIIIVTLINLSIEALIYIFPHIFLDFFSQTINERYLSFFSFQYGRGRIFGETLNEVFLPLFFFCLINSKVLKSTPIFLGMVLIFFSMFISGWRTKAILFVFGLITGLTIMGKKRIRIVVQIMALMVGLTVMISYVTRTINIPSTIDRFIDVNMVEAKNNSSRLNYWNEALDIGLSSPFFGVGLGNYFDQLSQKSKRENSNTTYYLSNKFIIIDDPHNLFFSSFATTGIIGLSSLILLILFFLKSDILYYRKYNQLVNAFIFSFWSVFLYAVFNPWMYFSYLSIFWFLRASIEKIKLLHPNG